MDLHNEQPLGALKKYDQVPELSLRQYLEGEKADRREFINDLFHGLKYFGFIILKDHPISVELLNKAYSLSEQLFALSAEQKIKYVSSDGAGQRGYTPFGKEHAKDSQVPDLKEFWHVGRDLPSGHRYEGSFPQNIWPHELMEFQSVFSEMYRRLDEVGRVVLQALSHSLDIPEDYFDSMTESGSSILRLLHYPPIPKGVDPRCIRAAAHEDINLITLLVSASASGLELLDRNGKWLPIETDPNNLIVDSGDMLSRITNDLIPSTTHRVVNPSGANQSRYSMPFFMHPNPDA